MSYILRFGDCLELMKDIPANSVDMILCDLPYGKTKNKWDSVIDLPSLWGLYDKIIKDNGAIVLFGQDKFSATLMFSNEKLHRYNLIWDKGDRGSGFLNAKRMPLRNHEDILVFYKKQPTYNPQFTQGKPLHGMGNKYKNGNLANNNYGKFDSYKNPSAERVGDTKKFPKSIIKYNKPHPAIHPTQKPVELCEWLIKTYTNKGETVLDNCVGSGTTIIACENTGRNCIAMERDEKIFTKCHKRVTDLYQS